MQKRDEARVRSVSAVLAQSARRRTRKSVRECVGNVDDRMHCHERTRGYLRCAESVGLGACCCLVVAICGCGRQAAGAAAGETAGGRGELAGGQGSHGLRGLSRAHGGRGGRHRCGPASRATSTRSSSAKGAEVKEGDALFEIDPRTYQADLAQKEAAVAQAEAHLKRLESDYQAGRRSCCPPKPSARPTSIRSRATATRPRRRSKWPRPPGTCRS